MLWGIVLLYVVCSTSIVQSHEPNQPTYKVLRVQVENDHHVRTLRQLQKHNQMDFWKEPESGSAMFSLPDILSSDVERKLLSEGMKPVTAIEDLQNAILKEKEENQPKTFEKRKLNVFNYARYHTLNEISTFLREVAAERSNLATLITLGRSYENRTISGLTITSGKQGIKPVVFLECGMHAREWVSPAVCLYIINQLTSDATPDTKKLLDKFEWYIIPTTNPDGYLYTWTGEVESRVWRKTRSRSQFSISQYFCMGADGNRNFDSNFCGVGTSKNPCSDTYCGDYAFSEKETKALRDVIKQIGDRLKIYFSIHSFSQLWMYPYGYTKSPAPNAKELDSLSEIGVKALEAVYGTQYEYGPISEVIYQASGSSVDWVYDVIGTKLAFALELRDTGMHGFLLPQNQILPTSNETWYGIQAVVNAV